MKPYANSETALRHLRQSSQVLIDRFEQLQQVPGGREALKFSEKVEYDLIGATLSNVRSQIVVAMECRS